MERDGGRITLNKKKKKDASSVRNGDYKCEFPERKYNVFF